MTSEDPRDKQALAAAAWRSLFDFIIATSAHRNKALERYDLTPNDSRALFSLDEAAGRPMRDLAAAWACDASNATWIVDRLERKGLAERRASPGDRRVKLVALTARGAQVRAAVSAEMYEPPPELLALDADELAALAAAAARLRR